jgi:chorismate-pyruvate lyase
MSKDFGSAVLRKISALEGAGARLSLERKILLAETGTVEQVLSIIAGSPVEVEVVRQSEARGVITREAVLSAKDTGRPLIRAQSKIYCKNLPDKIVRQLRQKKAGIGTIIFSSGLETFREIVRLGLNNDNSPYRVYRIFHDGMVAFEIREDVLI